ncbi:hypothetical protein FA95DRAFT_282413 [Auriscalpium vulgare]|uniref:Uncharacterized protein n=1 Tax=Auriscalpium vulgare TaxID=40419 RepID=A0ACB8S5Y7_9AGAM|nr:hypothetical protein FA95DRAFT_282413 [Auriscalpium vulgare]
MGPSDVGPVLYTWISAAHPVTAAPLIAPGEFRRRRCQLSTIFRHTHALPYIVLKLDADDRARRPTEGQSPCAPWHPRIPGTTVQNSSQDCRRAHLTIQGRWTRYLPGANRRVSTSNLPLAIGPVCRLPTDAPAICNSAGSVH